MGVCGAKQKQPKHKKEKSTEPKDTSEAEKINTGNEPSKQQHSHIKDENGKHEIQEKEIERNGKIETASVEPNENMDENKDDQNNFHTLKRNLVEDVYEMHLNAIEEVLKKKDLERFTHEDSEPEKRGDYYFVVSKGGYNV